MQRLERVAGVRRLYEDITVSVERVITGKTEVVGLCVTALLAGGHVLLTDVPGVGKTTLAKALAAAVEAEFGRIQFTPDLLPSDITGTSVYDPRGARFVWVAGPIFSPVLLADEINRATPRTQAALLEAMAEGQVSSDGESRPLPEPFFVVATRNPQGFHGTYPLPEGQLDRFMVAASMGYPQMEDEAGIIQAQVGGTLVEDVAAVATPRDLIAARETVSGVELHKEVVGYVVALAEATRRHPEVELGVSPRGSIALAKAAQARAAIGGREFVAPGDIKALAPHVLAHRIALRSGDSSGAVEVMDDVLRKVSPPA